MRSSHWKKEHARTQGDDLQLGIVTRVHYYTLDGEAPQTDEPWVEWPAVHWEGATMTSLCHPDNVRPARRTWSV